MASAAHETSGQGHPVHPPISTILDALSFRLARLNTLNERIGSGHFRKQFNMSLNEWRVLGLTSALEPLSFHRMRDLLLIDKGQLSRVVSRLTERDVIESRPCRMDGRSIELITTEAGRAMHDDMIAFTAERNEAVVEALSPEECAEFLRLLTKITRHNEELASLSELLT